ncbi:hypothetical protein KUTeg_016203 [Tegillarca granosa]|uniref:Uncharacterized protein n=1 Tax=Tegillarca granosa TaxID=220873 RepID=A0ABQ9EK66_TEGGR|nr:hypothetical protein KUTeg_016203 [Tegillarca granosa]
MTDFIAYIYRHNYYSARKEIYITMAAFRYCVVCFYITVGIVDIVSSGRGKRQGWFGQPKPPGKRCLFNPCDSGAQFCKNGAKCSLNEVNCMFICHCTDGYTGTKCENSIETVETDEGDKDEITTSATKRPITSQKSRVVKQSGRLRNLLHRTCVQGKICLHGYCDKIDGFRCICDPGWYGPLCAEKYGISTPSSQIKSQNVTIEKIRKLQTVDVCSKDYVLRPRMTRECAKGVLCVFGSCKSLDENQGFRCECDEGATGSLCDKKCCQKCGDNGICRIQNGKEYCSCKIGYIGDDCKEEIKQSPLHSEKETNWYVWLIGICACVLILLLVLVVIVPYYLWYVRNKTIMKAVYSLQPFEEDDGMKWDAFISYKLDGMDENFVQNKLKPVLENELGFTLCIPDRDFQDGKSLEKNILDAVLNSRRIIMVLTPRYIQSEFTRHEYHSATREMFKLKSRIIPIILDDISGVKKSTDNNLKKLISHVRSLKWSNEGNKEKENKFWEKVRLSMPKRQTLKTWQSGLRKTQHDNFLNDKQIVISFSENDKFVSEKDRKIPKYTEEKDSQLDKHTYENVAFESDKKSEN